MTYRFLIEKRTEILTKIREKNPICTSEIAKSILSSNSDAYSPYAYVMKVINEMTESGFIESKKIGRKRMITITEKGKEMAKALLKVREIENQ